MFLCPRIPYFLPHTGTTLPPQLTPIYLPKRPTQIVVLLYMAAVKLLLWLPWRYAISPTYHAAARCLTSLRRCLVGVYTSFVWVYRGGCNAHNRTHPSFVRAYRGKRTRT